MVRTAQSGARATVGDRWVFRRDSILRVPRGPGLSRGRRDTEALLAADEFCGLNKGLSVGYHVA